MNKLKEKWRLLSTKQKATAIGLITGGAVIGGVLTYFGVKNVKTIMWHVSEDKFDMGSIANAVSKLNIEPTEKLMNHYVAINKDVDMDKLLDFLESVKGTNTADSIDACKNFVENNIPVCLRISTFVKND